MDTDIAAYIIQTAWRSYQNRKHLHNGMSCAGIKQSLTLPSLDEEDITHLTLATSGYMTTSVSSCFSDIKTSNSDYRVSTSNTEDNLEDVYSKNRISNQKPLLNDVGKRFISTDVYPSSSREASVQRDTDSMSLMSDCSELMGQVGKLIREQLTASDPLLKPVIYVPGKDLPRDEKKANYLSLAHEFAQLKREDSNVLPFNLHQLQMNEPLASNVTTPEEYRLVPVSLGVSMTEISSRYSSTVTSPCLVEPDWSVLERELRRDMSGLSEREQVLQSLSMTGCDRGAYLPRRPSAGMEVFYRNDASSDTESSDGDVPGPWERYKRPPQNYIPKVSELTKPMQLCFISDLTSDEEEAHSSKSSSTLVTDSGIGGDPSSFRSLTRRPLEPELLESLTNSSSVTTIESEEEDLLSKQARLQAEAHLALAQAKPMAQMQIEVERHQQQQLNKDLVQELTGLGRGRRLQLSFLQEHSFGALQLIYNELLSKIEVYNEELVTSLIDRDDLHMEQDSMLVEVEDLTRRAQEIANQYHSSVQSSMATSPTQTPIAKTISPTSPSKSSLVRGRMSSITAKLKPNKLVSLFTGSVTS